MVGIRINGMWCDDPLCVKSQVKCFFESRFDALPESKLNLDGVCFRTITEDDNNILYSNITELEVLKVVSQCGSSKYPGPDRFNFFFVKNN